MGAKTRSATLCRDGTVSTGHTSYIHAVYRATAAGTIFRKHLKINLPIIDVY